MRRGHHNRGGWRNNRHEPPGKFWSRFGEVANFGPSRPNPWDIQPQQPRFGPPFRGHYVRHHGPAESKSLEYKNKNVYHNNNYGGNTPRQYQQHHDKYDKNNTNTNFHEDIFEEPRTSAEFTSQSGRVNYNEPPPSSNQTNYKYDQTDYSPMDYNTLKHRPPPLLSLPILPDCFTRRSHSTNIYDKNSTPVKETQETFSRSVDDTVNIIRKRLIYRNENPNQDPPLTQDHDKIEDVDKSRADDIHHCNAPRELLNKKKYIKHRQTISSANCDKLKNKIVHQLFKMDKDAIHKLLDNPNSSAKFEYALSSLLTESQNSFNRHMRAAAERSLNTANNEQFQYQNEDTIYEDTFLKQMQCILDPLDTVLLTDMKPIVMAELNKVLHLDDNVRYDFADEDEIFHERVIESETARTPSKIINMYEDPQKYKNSTNSNKHNSAEGKLQNAYPDLGDNKLEKNLSGPNYDIPKDKDLFPKKGYEEVLNDKDNLFQSQWHTPVNNYNRRDRNDSLGTAADNNHSDNIHVGNADKQPLFSSHAELLSDEEDPFDELDKQYHVAVDPNFIENDSITDMSRDDLNSQQLVHQNPDYRNYHPNEYPNPDKFNKPLNSEACTSINSVQEKVPNLNISDNTTKLSPKLEEPFNINKIDKPSKLDLGVTTKLIKKERNVDFAQADDSVYIKSGKSPEKRNRSSSIHRPSSDKSVTEKLTEQRSSRKRSTDQRQCHRKEKRKKTEIGKGNDKILNKNIIINVTDCSSKPSEKCDSNTKSIFNLFFSKTDKGSDVPKESKQNTVDDISYSEKYVKRKDVPKKSIKDEGSKSRRHSSSSTNATQDNAHAPVKTDNKKKLTAIDMFLEQPKKPHTLQTHRHTAFLNTDNNQDENNKYKSSKSDVIKDTKTTSVLVSKKNKEVQTMKSMQVTSRYCQTPTKLSMTIGTQTHDITKSKSSNVYERMKELDLEIQLLLQEKFKVYNSIDTKDARSSVRKRFGMTVVNMSPYQDTSEATTSEDAMIENLTNLPEEELEQMAFQGVDDTIEPESQTNNDKTSTVKRTRRARSGHAKDSPIVKPMKMESKRTRHSSISLIEQIIEDDRPLEDIISLDDLESSPVKTKKSKRIKKKAVKAKTKTKTVERPQRKTVVQLQRITVEQPQRKTVKQPQRIVVKPCSVRLLIEDFSEYLPLKKDKTETTPPQPEEQIVPVTEIFQYDMLDVSEDIVIGDNSDKTEDTSVVLYQNNETPNIDEVVDNSQSNETCEQADIKQNVTDVKTYDFSVDGDCRRDVLAVSGNADAILAIECFGNNFLAACLDGNVYYYSSEGQLQKTLRGSNLAVTCLTIVEEKFGTTVYTGSLDSRIRYYDLQTGLEKGPECNVLSPIQTMDRAWDTIFVGTRTGFVLQFECKNNMLIPVSTIKFSDQSILALRALKEGPRKVLLVAARSENVTIKDAQTGLLLRTLDGPKMTVYTLLYEEGKVFCGTSSHQIQVFDYASGSHVGEHEGGKGAVCLRASGGLLFAGCYDGCVYVYQGGERTPMAQLRGPSVMLLSLAIVNNKIIAGYNDRSLYVWKIPDIILQEMIL